MIKFLSAGRPEMFSILAVTTFAELQSNISAVNKFLNHDHDSAFYTQRHDRHDPDF
jgi:hypothetical protein